MARTQAADYEQRREAIVDKAAQLFARSGFQGTSVQDLATACETSKSLLYHYYPSKEDVLYAVMASHIDQLVADVEEVMGSGAAPVDQLSNMIHAFMRHYIGAADRQNVLLNELGNLPADKRDVVIEKQRVVIDAVQSLMVRIHPTLAANPARARVQTMLLFGMINWTKTWFHPGGPINADELADIVVTNALRAETVP